MTDNDDISVIFFGPITLPKVSLLTCQDDNIFFSAAILSKKIMLYLLTAVRSTNNVNSASSLHWPILVSFRVFFVHWSIFTLIPQYQNVHSF